MTKKITGAVLALLMALLLVPVMAFAEGGHRIEGDLNLANGGHEGKTLTTDGYTWDATGNVLTMQNLTVTGTVTLPNMDCTVNVMGTCSVGMLNRGGDTSSEPQKTAINGVDGGKLSVNIEVAGDLELNNLTMTDGAISSASVGLKKLLSLKNSNITLHDLDWPTYSGIDLINSTLTMKDDKNMTCKFRVEMIAMDGNSTIISELPLGNYGNRNLADFGDVLGYVTAPVGGYFAQYKESPSAADTQNTIVVEKTENGVTVVERAMSFTLGKPKATQPEQPAENEPVKEPEKEPEKPAERPVRRYSNVTAAVEEAPKTIEAAKTGDPGVVLYAASAVLSAAGMAWAGRKRGQ